MSGMRLGLSICIAQLVVEHSWTPDAVDLNDESSLPSEVALQNRSNIPIVASAVVRCRYKYEDESNEI